jgi:hypothetical protein
MVTLLGAGLSIHQFFDFFQRSLIVGFAFSLPRTTQKSAF